MSNYDDYKSNKYDHLKYRNRKTLWSSWSSDDDDGDENKDWELTWWKFFHNDEITDKKVKVKFTFAYL